MSQYIGSLIKSVKRKFGLPNCKALAEPLLVSPRTVESWEQNYRRASRRGVELLKQYILKHLRLQMIEQAADTHPGERILPASQEDISTLPGSFYVTQEGERYIIELKYRLASDAATVRRIRRAGTLTELLED